MLYCYHPGMPGRPRAAGKKIQEGNLWQTMNPREIADLYDAAEKLSVDEAMTLPGAILS